MLIAGFPIYAWNQSLGAQARKEARQTAPSPDQDSEDDSPQ